MSGFGYDVACAALACESAEEFARFALRRIGEAVAYDSAVYVFFPPHVVVTVNTDPVYMQRFVSRSRSYGDELDKGRRTAMRNGGVYIDTEVFSPTERKSLAFYRDIIQPQGIGSQLALYLMLRRRMFGVVHLCRRMGRPGFREMDLSVLRPMLPILVTSHAAVMAAEGLRACGQQQGPMECTLASLSGREREVAHYVAHGLSNKEIASFLGTSPNTVRNQLVRIFEKLGVSSRAELASQLARGGLADFPMPVPDLSAAG